MPKKKQSFIFVLLFFAAFISLVYIASKAVPFLYGLLVKKEIQLKQQEVGKINFLLLGIGGGSHEGPNLSDTIIFASINPEKNKVTLVSIPRDLWVSSLGARVNTAYAFGEEKQEGGGKILAKSVVEKIVGQPIDYVVRIDFDGFIKAVDLLGGIDVNVERTLDDYGYPIEGKEDDPCGFAEDEIATFSARIATGSATEVDSFPCRYKHLHVPKGLNNMDGELALQFVRSRHALGAEGSDFARSKRQEKVISAIKDKVFSVGTILNPVRIVALYNTFKDNIDTDIQVEEADDFIKLAQKMQGAKISSGVIDYGSIAEGREGLLVNPPISEEYRNAWVLIPKRGTDDYSEIHDYVSCLTGGKRCPAPTSIPTNPAF